MATTGAELLADRGAVLGGRNLEALDDLLDPGFVDHGSGGIGVDAFRARVAGLLEGLPNLRYVIERVLDDGGFVASHVTLEGTHTGPLLGIPPTGRTVHVTSVDLLRRGADGRIAERWEGLDTFGLLQQLGAMPGARTAATS